MNAREKELVQESFAKVEPIADAAADLFYGRLFALDPSLRPMFKHDLTEQKMKLMQTLAVAVRGLDDLDSLVPVLQALGRRHVDYGVEAPHYDTVGAALLWTLEQGLGDDFTPATEEAWIAVYDIVAATMKEAAETVGAVEGGR
jgi:hemoglobin-like flavoprotein